MKRQIIKKQILITVVLLGLLSMTFSVSAAPEATVTLSEDDVAIFDNNAAVLANDAVLRTRASAGVGGSCSSQAETFLKFDLNSLGSTNGISAATLTMTVESYDDGGSAFSQLTVSLFGFEGNDASWSEGNTEIANYASRPSKDVDFGLAVVTNSAAGTVQFTANSSMLDYLNAQKAGDGTATLIIEPTACLTVNPLSPITQFYHSKDGSGTAPVLDATTVSWDWGDLGDGGPSDAAWHNITGPTLGSSATADSGFVSNDSDTDDATLSYPDGQWGDGSGSIQVNVTGSGCVYGWIDWDSNGFETGDNIGSATVSGGTATLNVTVPGGTFPSGGNQTFNIRLRVVSGSCGSLSPTGGATSGEVEDHAVTFSPTPIEFKQLSAAAAPISPLIWLAIALPLVTLFGLFIIRRRETN